MNWVRWKLILAGASVGLVVPDLAAVNVANQGLIPTLLRNAVEAMLRVQTTIDKLFVSAFDQKSKGLFLQALPLDPTTHSYTNSVTLVNRVCELQSEVLPDLRSGDG
jgi:alpha-galactosidase/6-phospho-beta-glucosidase family protein